MVEKFLETCYATDVKNIKLVKWILAVAIVIVLNLFFTYGINAVYPPAVYDLFCPREQVTVIPGTQDECVAKGGSWTEGPNQKLMRPLPHIETDSDQVTGYCDLSFTCAKNFGDAAKLYARNVFVARVVLGMLVLILGFFASSYASVSLGLMFGGILSLLIGTIGYWSEMHDYLRVTVLGDTMFILIWLGINKH